MVPEIKLFARTDTKTSWRVIKLNLIFINFILIFNYCLIDQYCYTETTYLLQFVLNVRKTYRQLQWILPLVCEDRVFFVWSDLHKFYAGSNIQNCERDIRLVYPHFFCKFPYSCSPENRTLTDLGLEIQRAPFRQQCRIRHTFIEVFSRPHNDQ